MSAGAQGVEPVREKSGAPDGKQTTGPKGRVDFIAFMPEINLRPTLKPSFSAAGEAHGSGAALTPGMNPRPTRLPQPGDSSPEPPRVRAARRFLARRGVGHRSLPTSQNRDLGHPQPEQQILRFAQDDNSVGRDDKSAARNNKAVVRDGESPVGLGAGIAPQGATVPVWTSVGPVGVNSLEFGLVTGRVSAIALDPSDASGNHAFVGTTGGGLWKSQNAAATATSSVVFLPLTDSLGALSGALQAGISVGAVTVQPGGTGVVLAGLGDPNDALDSYYGAGLLRSADGGQTWTLITQTMDLEDQLGSRDFSFVGEGFAGFAWSTVNTQLVVAAVSQAYEGTLVNAGQSSTSLEGLYWSNDGGATWHLGRITDLDGEDVQGPSDGFALPDGNAATSVVWNPVRRVFVAAVRYHGYYLSTDGMNWTQMPAFPNGQPSTGLTPGNCPTEPGSVGVAGCPIFRGSLAVNPQTGDTFAWTVDAFNQDQGIWQDQCQISGGVCGNSAITFGVQLQTAPLETADGNGPATIENGDYNLTLAAVPSALGQGQDTLIFAGDNDLWKCSLANSCQWRNTTNSTTCMSAQVGEYQHGFAWDTGNPSLLYVGTDSGLWRSTDLVGETGSPCAATDASHWQNLNASLGSLAEVDSLAEAASTASTLLTGLGANGVAGIVGAPAKSGDWNEVLGGEGGPVAIDPAAATNNWYANNAAGVSILNCDSTTACTAAGFGTAPAIGEAQVEDDGFSMPYPAEFRLDLVTPMEVVIGTCRVWRGPANGVGWTAANAISPVLDGTNASVCDGNALIRTMAIQMVTGGGEVIYAGMAGAEDGGGVVPGHVFTATVTANGVVSNWTDVALSPVVNNGLAFNAFGLDVSGLYVDPHDGTGETVYATIAGFSSLVEPVQQVYRTTDGGAHWSSIVSNLPNAPVNAVVVDATDANTVYLATDVGVYATRAIGSCGALAATACWSQYGTGLPLAPVTTLTTTSASASTAVLTAGTYGRGVWQIPPATSGLAVTTATVSPASLTFANTTVGVTTAAQVVTLKATGTTALTVTGVVFTGAASGDFSDTNTCVGIALAKNATCQVKVSFTPTETGARPATVAIQANVAGGQLLVPLTGSGLATASVTLTPASASFGTQAVGTASATQSFNVQNTGGSSLTITSIAVSAPFVRTGNSCGSTLAANTGCAVTLDFTPKQAGAATGILTVTDSVGVQSAALSGTGVLGPTDVLSTTSLTLAPTVVGQVSPPLTVTLTNNGGLPLTSIGTSVSDTLSNGDFSVVSDCGSQLAPNSSCGITVEFSPTIATTEQGTLLISDALRAQGVHLQGTGLKPPTIAVAPVTIAFGGEQVLVPSAARTLTISNKGGSPLLNPGFTLLGVGAASFSLGATTCGVSVAAGSSCSVGVIFAPQATGATSATLEVTTSSPGVVPGQVALTGTGLSPPMLGVSPTALNLGSVVVGNTSLAFTVQVTNVGQVAMAEPTFGLSGFSGPSGGGGIGDFVLSPPPDITPCTGPLAPGASCNIQVTFGPSVVGVERATLTVTASNAIPPTATVTVMGTGAPAIVLQANMAELQFPATPVGTTGATLTTTISNLGRQTANGLTLAVSGPYALVAGSTTCEAKLPGSSSCTAGVSFAPTASGDQPGALTVTVSNLGVSALVVPLNGSGQAVGGITATPTQMTFGSVVLGQTSAAQALTVSNSGQANLTGLHISTTGSFRLAGNLCTATLAAGASCTTGVEMTPVTTGIQSGTLTILTTSAGVAPAVVPLTGNGIPSGSLTVAPAVLSFGALTVGQTSVAQPVTVSNTGATTLAGLTFQVAGDYSLTQNQCGTQLARGTSCTFAATFSPSAPGTRIGSVTIHSTAAGFTPVVEGLTGAGVPAAQLAVTPLHIQFGTVGVGSNSAAMPMKVSNPGTGTLTGLSIVTAAPFSVGSGSCGTSVAAGGSCSVPVTFAPRVGGAQSGTVMVSTSSLGVPAAQVGLLGTGQTPASLSLSPATLQFAATTIGKSSAGQVVTVTNRGGAGLAGLSLGITGAAARDFAIVSSGCGTTLSVGGSCTLVVSFAPTVAGGRQAFLTGTSTAAGVVAASATLDGTGLTPASLLAAPALLSFAPTPIGATSSTQVVTVKNSGQSGITDLAVAVSGEFLRDSVRTTCTAVLAAGASCTVGVDFAPTSGGSQMGSMTVSSVLSGGTAATTALSGTGASPPGIVTLPAALVQFGTTGVGQMGQPVTVTVTNAGTLSALTGLTLAVDAAGAGNGFGLTANTCGSTLAARASCTVQVTFAPAFAPQSAEALTGALTIQSGNGGSASLALAGIAFGMTMNVLGSSSMTIVPGQTAYYTLAVTPRGASSGAIRFACGTLPANAICLFNPGQLMGLRAGVSGDVILGISAGAPATIAQQSGERWRTAGLLLCGLAGLPLAWRRKRAGRWLAWLLCIWIVCGVTSCASSGGFGDPGGAGHAGGGTPPGSYPVTVTATSDGVNESVNLTLVVN